VCEREREREREREKCERGGSQIISQKTLKMKKGKCKVHGSML